MDQLRFTETAYRLQHRHKDGSWADMEEVPREHHSPADHDPERAWSLRRIFRCKTCAESATIIPGEEGQGPESTGSLFDR